MQDAFSDGLRFQSASALHHWFFERYTILFTRTMKSLYCVIFVIYEISRDIELKTSLMENEKFCSIFEQFERWLLKEYVDKTICP